MLSDPLLRTLFVHTPGTRLVLDGNAVKALREGAPMRRLPLEAIDAIIVLSGVDVSTPLLLHCAEHGRLVAFLSRHGKPRAVVEGVADGRSELRRRQYAAHADPGRRIQLASTVVRGKVSLMAWSLRQWARDSTADHAISLRELAACLDDALIGLDNETQSRERLLGIEGETTRRYFAALGLVLKDAPWNGRSRRPPTDPVNAMLSWMYAMTRLSVQGAVMVAGLDAGTGFLHGDRASQPSLVLDLMEEFRPAADRVVVRLWNTGRVQDRHFERDVTGAVGLTSEGRELLFDAWHKHRTTEVQLKGRAETVPNGYVPIIQAHRLANALRYTRTYEPHARRIR